MKTDNLFTVLNELKQIYILENDLHEHIKECKHLTKEMIEIKKKIEKKHTEILRLYKKILYKNDIIKKPTTK